MRDKIQTLERELKDAIERSSNREFEFAPVTAELKELKATESDLRTANELLHGKLGEAEQTIDELETKIQELSDEKLELRTANADLEKNLEGASEHIVNQGEQLKSLDEQYNKALKALNQTTTDLNQTSERLREFKRVIEELEARNNNLNVQIADLQLAANAHSDNDYEAIDKTLLGEITTVGDERVKHLEDTITSLNIKLQEALTETPAELIALKDEIREVENRLSRKEVQLREQVARADAAERKANQNENDFRELTELNSYCKARHV